MKVQLLKPSKQLKFKRQIFAFDIETAESNKKFLLATIVGTKKKDRWGNEDRYIKTFYNKQDFVDEIRTNHIFRNSIMYATNLGFDFFGLVFGTKESGNFHTLFRGADLIIAKTYFDGDTFTPIRKRRSNPLKSITFLDSMNYAKMSVKKMGEVVKMNKFNFPFKDENGEDDFNHIPKDAAEWDQLLEYNIRDTEITLKFMTFLNAAFENLGATVKSTVASTAMSLFKNKYLDRTYIQNPEPVLLDILKSYYGGRTEAFYRGTFEQANYYDINSLYPSVMRDFEFPDPNSLRTSQRNSVEYIKCFEGVSDVTVFVPPQDIPILPAREDGKCKFGHGKLTGWYTHIELREAIKQGAVIMEVRKSHIYTKTCRPFKAYVEDLYAQRKLYKGDPMDVVIKLMLNSLYGKFGQRFLDKQNTVHADAVSMKDIQTWSTFERVGDYFVYKQNARPSSFCIPIWATYVTAYARLRLLKALQSHDVYYCDTDSVITKDEIPTSGELGEFKLEMRIEEGIIVRPKFYAFKAVPTIVNGETKQLAYVKIKGLKLRLNYLEFIGLLHSPYVEFDKFVRFKEAIRRDLIPNEIIHTHKLFSLNDDKRVWQNHSFEIERFEKSTPPCIIEETYD